MKIEGACHCGAISYEAQVDPANSIICHCTDCQTISGAPYRVNVPVAAAKLDLRGTPTRYVKIGGSGEEVITAFCGTCGAGLYSHKGETPKFLFLRVGAMKQRADLPPRFQGFCSSAVPWSSDISQVPVAPSQRPGAGR